MTKLPTTLLRLLLSVAVLHLPSASLAAQEAAQTTARDLLLLKKQARDKTVEVIGKVSRFEGSNAFILEDDYGVGIRVVVTGARPARDLRVTVQGIVAIDGDDNAYIMAQRIAEPNTRQDPPSPPADVDRDLIPDTIDRCPATPQGKKVDASGCPYSLLSDPDTKPIIVGAFGVLALAIGLFVALRKPSTPPPTFAPSASGGSVAPGGAGGAIDIDEGKTIRVARPDSAQGTLQILPGRLEITGGGDQGRVSDIRFVRDPLTTGDPEMTFGRSGAVSPTHIILKSQTVSRLHAKMRFSGARWTIQNFSDTNPLLLNGQPLRVDMPPAALKTGDTIEMGEVSFKFHER